MPFPGLVGVRGEADDADAGIDAAPEVGAGAIETVPLGELGGTAVGAGNFGARVAVADEVELAVAGDAGLRGLRDQEAIAGRGGCGR